MPINKQKIASRKLGYLIPLVLCVFLSSACSRYIDVSLTADESEMMDSVLTYLNTVDESPLAEAFYSHVSYDFPEDRGYNKKRHETKYRYRFLPDSLMSGRSIRVADIEVRSDAVAEVPVQNIRFFIDRESLNVIAIRLRRKSESMLYREESVVYLEGRTTESGAILPVRFNIETTVKAFFSDPVSVSTDSEFDASGDPI